MPDLFGSTKDVQYWQITPMGASRVESGTLTGLDPMARLVLRRLSELGGIADVDELTSGGLVPPNVIGTPLRSLMKLGLAIPAEPAQETVPR